jgi:broad specificity phosphatase PhoE
MKVALIPCSNTEWYKEGRLLGRVELPAKAAPDELYTEWASALESVGLERILHAPDELATQTAAAVARRLSVPTKPIDDLVEVDMGLWAGLTESQLKSRFPSAHRELREAPLNVHPPGGEELAAASKRLTACIQKQCKKNGTLAIGIVMRPLSLAMTRSVLEQRELTDVLEAARDCAAPLVLEVPVPAKRRSAV